MSRQPNASKVLNHSGEGSSQQVLLPVANNREVVTNDTLPTVATIIQDLGAPTQSADLDAANCRLVIRRNPTFNLILKPIVMHASAPENLWAECTVVGVRELPWVPGTKTTRYIREVIGTLKFQGSAATFTSTEAAPVEGLGTNQGNVVFAPCDVADATPYIPSPEIMVIGEVAGGSISFAFDGWSYPFIELYPSVTVPSGESGSGATAVTFWYTEC